MKSNQINYYVENKYSDDIVYPYSNGEEDRYRKTEKGVLLIHKSRNGNLSERFLSECEFPLSEFDRMKTISDEDYRERNKGDMREFRNTVSLNDLEETRICSHELSAEDEYLNSHSEEDEDENYRTIENAMEILDLCLSDTQKRRFIMHIVKGLSFEEIAEMEGVYWTSIRESISGAKKKIKKFLSRSSKTPAKNASKMYIGEGQEKK